MKKEKEQMLEEPLVERIPYSKLQNGDVLLLRCKRGEEQQALLSMRSELKFLIKQKDLRILAVTPEADFSQLSISIEAAKDYNK